MSLLSNIHDFRPFDAKSSKPFENQRLEKVTYKNTKKNPARFASVCVSIPQVGSITSKEQDQLRPHVVELLHHAQKGIVQDLHEAGKTSVTDAELSVSSCIVFLDAELAGNRLSAERVENWFDSEVSESLTVLLSEKLGFSSNPSEDQLKRLEKNVKEYRENFSSLSGGRTSFDPETSKKMIRVLEVTEVSDELSVRFTARLRKMAEQQRAELEAL